MGFTTDRLHPDLRGEVQRFIEAATRDDNTAALSEYKAMRVEGSLDTRECVATADDGSVVGYGQAAWHRGTAGDSGHWAVEVVVAGGLRRTEIVGGLLATLRAEAGVEPVVLWARAEHIAHTALNLGWQRERELLEMHRSLPIAELDAAFSDFELATFRMGVDETAWLEANNAAFAGHPENGDMTRRDLEIRMAQSWFDPRGFLLAWDEDRLVGSCWTKIHDNGTGEIYIIGVVPGWEGRGLGRDLVSQGLYYLGSVRNVKKAMLFVEASNERAVRLYESLGFEAVRAIAALRYPPNS